MRQQQFFLEHEEQIMVPFTRSTIEGTIVPGAWYMVEGVAQPHQAAENRHRPILELHTPTTCTAWGDTAQHGVTQHSMGRHSTNFLSESFPLDSKLHYLVKCRPPSLQVRTQISI